MSTIDQALGTARQLLAGETAYTTGETTYTVSETTQLDAELLLAFCLQQSRSYLYTWPERQICEQQLDEYNALLVRRTQGEPIAHLLGHREFWTMDLEVNAHTLIPRPETELLVETALQLLPKKSMQVLDLGTGSGAIALALASERPQWQVFASDLYWPAICLCQRNQQQLSIGNVNLFQGHWATCLKPGSFQLLVSNPPYIDAADQHLIHGDVRFEPRSALVANKQGLADIEIIVKQAWDLLCIGGWLMLEHGFEQGAKVRHLAANFHEVSTLQDLAGHDRVTICRR